MTRIGAVCYNSRWVPSVITQMGAVIASVVVMEDPRRGIDVFVPDSSNNQNVTMMAIVGFDGGRGQGGRRRQRGASRVPWMCPAKFSCDPVAEAGPWVMWPVLVRGIVMRPVLARNIAMRPVLGRDIGHRYIGHNYIGHNYIGHDAAGPRSRCSRH